MMIKANVGRYEFEASGSVESVTRFYRMWTRMLRKRLREFNKRWESGP